MFVPVATGVNSYLWIELLAFRNFRMIADTSQNVILTRSLDSWNLLPLWQPATCFNTLLWYVPEFSEQVIWGWRRSLETPCYKVHSSLLRKPSPYWFRLPLPFTNDYPWWLSVTLVVTVLCSIDSIRIKVRSCRSEFRQLPLNAMLVHQMCSESFMSWW